MSEDFEQVASSEEDITSQQLKYLITLTKKEYRKRGVNLDRCILQRHTVDTEMLESITQSIWSKTVTVLDVLTKAFYSAVDHTHYPSHRPRM